MSIEESLQQILSHCVEMKQEIAALQRPQAEPQERSSSPLLSVQEVAARYDCDTTTVRGWIRRGLKASRAGGVGHWRINAADLERFLSNRPAKLTAAPDPDEEAARIYGRIMAKRK